MIMLQIIIILMIVDIRDKYNDRSSDKIQTRTQYV